MPAPSEEIERHAARWAKDPKSRVFAQLADAYRKEGFLDEAIEICLQGLKDHPNYVSGRVVLGRAYLEKGELDRAEAEFMRIIELDPENIPAHRLLGDIFLKQSRQDEARECYEAVLGLSPFDREVKELLLTLPAAPTVPSASPAESAHGSSADQPPELPHHALGLEPSSPPIEPPPDLVLEGITPGLPEVGPPSPPPEGETQAPALGDVRDSQESLEEVPLSETLADLYVQQGLVNEAATLYRKLLEKEPSKGHLKRKLEALDELRRLHDDLSKAPERTATRPGVEEELGGWEEGHRSRGVETEGPVLAVRPETPQHQEDRSDSEQRLLTVFEEWLEELRRLKSLRQRS